MQFTKLTVRIPKSLRQKLDRERKALQRELGYRVTWQDFVTEKLTK